MTNYETNYKRGNWSDGVLECWEIARNRARFAGARADHSAPHPLHDSDHYSTTPPLHRPIFL
jgi:hypothetical protein